MQESVTLVIECLPKHGGGNMATFYKEKNLKDFFTLLSQDFSFFFVKNFCIKIAIHDGKVNWKVQVSSEIIKGHKIGRLFPCQLRPF